MAGTPRSSPKKKLELAKEKDALLNGSEGVITDADQAVMNIQRLIRGKTGREQAFVQARRNAHEAHQNEAGAAAEARHAQKMRERRKANGIVTAEDKAFEEARFEAEVRKIEEERAAHEARHEARIAKQKKRRWKRSTKQLVLIQRAHRRSVANTEMSNDETAA